MDTRQEDNERGRSDGVRSPAVSKRRPLISSKYVERLNQSSQSKDFKVKAQSQMKYRDYLS